MFSGNSDTLEIGKRREKKPQSREAGVVYMLAGSH